MLASIVGSSDDMIVSKTLDGIIASYNKPAERIMGYSEAEIIGGHIRTIIPRSRLVEETYIINQIRNGQKVDHFESFRLTQGGKEIPLSITVSPILDRKGEIIGASKIARDITDKRKAEKP